MAAASMPSCAPTAGPAATDRRHRVPLSRIWAILPRSAWPWFSSLSHGPSACLHTSASARTGDLFSEPGRLLSDSGRAHAIGCRNACRRTRRDAAERFLREHSAGGKDGHQGLRIVPRGRPHQGAAFGKACLAAPGRDASEGELVDVHPQRRGRSADQLQPAAPTAVAPTRHLMDVRLQRESTAATGPDPAGRCACRPDRWTCGRKSIDRGDMHICLLDPDQLPQLLDFCGPPQSLTVRAPGDRRSLRVFKDRCERFVVPQSRIDRWEIPGR